MTTPKEYTSLRSSQREALVNCSGDMYVGVPKPIPSSVRMLSSGEAVTAGETAPASSDASITPARPKSVIFSVPSWAIMMFAGFTSRWQRMPRP